MVQAVVLRNTRKTHCQAERPDCQNEYLKKSNKKVEVHVIGCKFAANGEQENENRVKFIFFCCCLHGADFDCCLWHELVVVYPNYDVLHA